jgi:uncharacterized membrane protein YcaP (DUF421 family)
VDAPVIPFDLHRMFLGDDPPMFYLEIAVRCALIYAWTLLLLRWIGGRSVTQLSLVEFLLVIALGSAVGDALFYPEVPLLQAMLVILVVVVIDKAIDEAILRWPWAKRAVDGRPVELLRDGLILQGAVSRRTMGTAELAAALRASGVHNLGEVDRVWMEANGKLSILRRDTPLPGLAISPPHEIAAPPEPPPAATHCCANCGLSRPTAAGNPSACPNCGQTRWTRPVIGPGSAAGAD